MVSLGYDPSFLATSDALSSRPQSCRSRAARTRILCGFRWTTRTSRCGCTPPADWRGGWRGTSTDSRSSRATRSPAPGSGSSSTRAFQPRPRQEKRCTRRQRPGRGHLARRSDLLWGATLAEALAANSDSFSYCNVCPQRAGFNQSGRGGVWGLLENAVLALDGLEDRRLSVFAGPVLAADDPTYRDVVQLPREFWKIVVYRVDDRLRFKAFLLTRTLTASNPSCPVRTTSSTTSIPTSSHSTCLRPAPPWRSRASGTQSPRKRICAQPDQHSSLGRRCQLVAAVPYGVRD